MIFSKVCDMVIDPLMRRIVLMVLMVGLLSPPSYADEIIFKVQGVQAGTVLEIDEETVTIRFPRQSIQSIIMGPEGVSTPEKKKYLKSAPPTDTRLQERVKGIQERMERLEENLQRDKTAAGGPSTLGPPKKDRDIGQLLQEEMGRVEGVILWNRKPLDNGKVMIVLERYTGFSWASLKKMFSGTREKSSDQEITFTTQTDSQGRYIFDEVPPGEYRLYWVPDPETGWVHRLRDRPDFEVISGKLTVQNIPGNKK